ncbi:hydrogen peroxide-inducible genes activator [Thiomicrorhabdus sediminis]|uniref:LysR family transcriptional regulator n=1 Tax=Thiomicrorhabdus sediminis TaxID=2580412 RepID=A0A4P9K2T1_9GAMM|nr:hydrogen peroxide-inducible genes activator [Thiomicrorhabdus sediminis]QCU89154.1 LysR family transcriptional regulator [Thiomicrorhabdus sediminis]
MTLSELKYIVALAKAKHFGKASEMCFVSQPTLSVAIKKFEEELGVSLFERRKKDILITPIGEQVILLAENIIEKTQQIKQIAKDSIDDLNTELRLGIIYTIGPYLLPKLVPILKKLAPDTHLIIEENFTTVLSEKLQNGELDLVILSLPFKEANIETLELYEEPFMAIVPNDDPLAEKTALLTAKDLIHTNILLLGSGHCFRDQVVEAFPTLQNNSYNHAALQKTFEGSSLETIRYMVASGVGSSIVPATSLSERDQGLFSIKTLQDPVPTRKVALAWRKTYTRDKVFDLFEKAIKQIEFPGELIKK